MINQTCLKENLRDIDYLPYSRDPYILYVDECVEFRTETIYTNKKMGEKRFKKYIEINPVISDKEIKVLYIFTGLVYDKAGNNKFEVSNPVISHPICYKYDLDFCYFEGKVKKFSKYVEQFLLNQTLPGLPDKCSYKEHLNNLNECKED